MSIDPTPLQHSRPYSTARSLPHSMGKTRLALMSLALIGASAWLAPQARAQTYTCQINGRTVVADQPIPECSHQAMRMTNNVGLTRVIPAPLTAEQKQQQDIELAKKRAAEDAVREQVRKDRALLASYSTVDQIEENRNRSLQDAKELISASNERLALLAKDRQANATEAASFKDKPLPPLLKRRMDDTDTAISMEERSVVSSKSDLDRINQKYDAEKQRFLMLTSGK